MQKLSAHSGLIAAWACMGALYLSGLGSHGMLMWDEAHYAVLGRALASGNGYVGPDGTPESLRPPVLPAAVAAVLIVNPDATDATVLRITVAATLLCIAVIYGCASLAGGVVAATSAAFLFATFPEIWRSTTYLLTEIPFMLFYTPAVFFFHRGLHTDSKNFMVAWPCFALALMTRYTAVLFGPTCILMVAVALLMRDREAIARMRSRHFLLGPVLAALLLAPIFARNWMLFGDPLIGLEAAARQLPEYSKHAQMPWSYYLSLLPTMMGWLPTIALALAIVDTVARRDRLRIDCLIAATVIIAWLSQYGWKEPRLISAALPFVAIMIGLSLGRSWAYLRSRQVSGESAQAPALIVAAGTLLFAAAIRLDPGYARAQWEIGHFVTLGHPSFRSAMAAVAERTPESAVLMGPNCYQMSWYSHRACRPLPAAQRLESTGSALADHLAGVDYVVATSFERGQPTYLENEWRRAERHGASDEAGAARVETFRDRAYWTKIIPAELLRRPSRAASDATS